MEQLYKIKFRSIYNTICEEGWTFILICAYLFFEYVRPQSIYTALDVLPWTFIILAVTACVLITSGQLTPQPNVLNKLMVCYALVVLFSSAFSQYPSVSFSYWRLFFNWFVIYFLIVFIVKNEKRFFVFFFSFLLYSLKMSQHGFISWVRRGFTFAKWGVTGAPGFFQNSGEVGIQMCIYVPLSIAFIIAVYPYLSKPKCIFLFLMPFTGIGTVIASSSRGAIVGLAVASIRFLIIRPVLSIITTLMIVAIAGTVYFSMPSQFMLRFDTAGSDSTSTHRLFIWHNAIDALHKHPVLGVGFNAWSTYYPKHYEVQKGTLLVHNVFVQCGSELGYTGLMVFISMIIACFMNTRKVRQLGKGTDDQFLAILSYGFDAALLGFLGSGFFVTVLYYPYFWIHCAMTTCLHSAAKEKYLPNKLAG